MTLHGSVSAGAWSVASGNNNNDQWIAADLGEQKVLVSIVTQGSHGYDEYVKKYTIQIKIVPDFNYIDVVDEDGYVIEYEANNERYNYKTNDLPGGTIASSVKLRPTQWHSHISLRWNIMGCENSGP